MPNCVESRIPLLLNRCMLFGFLFGLRFHRRSVRRRLRRGFGLYPGGWFRWCAVAGEPRTIRSRLAIVGSCPRSAGTGSHFQNHLLLVAKIDRSEMRILLAPFPNVRLVALIAGEELVVAEMGENIANAHRVLIWSDSDRYWRVKLDSIKPDPNAGSYERAHFANRSNTDATWSSVSKALDLTSNSSPKTRQRDCRRTTATRPDRQASETPILRVPPTVYLLRLSARTNFRSRLRRFPQIVTSAASFLICENLCNLWIS